MNLEQLRSFARVVEAGSFTRAADVLAVQKSQLSRVIAHLESELGVKLLERTTRTLSVTEVGREVYERAVGILEAVDDTRRVVQKTQGEPRGSLRLTCGVEFGLIAVGAWINEYLAAHPKMTAEVEYTSRLLDLVHEGFDLAVRVGTLEESRLAARQIGTLEYGLFACPHYVEAHGAPASIEALKQHALVMLSTGSHRAGWRLRRDGETVKVEGPARLRVNNSFAVRDAMLRSLGVGQLPLMVAADAVEQKRLVQVLGEWEPMPVPVHVVFPSNRYLTPKVRAFIDLAIERFPKPEQFADWRLPSARCHTTKPGARSTSEIRSSPSKGETKPVSAPRKPTKTP